jgi:hypothetical protein
MSKDAKYGFGRSIDLDRQELKQWFTEVWNDGNLVKDVKQDVLLYLRKLYANQSPQFIYYLTLFHLFRDYLEGTRDLDDNLRRVALPDTRIWRTLFSFQKDGAKAAINKVLDYNGCILADSVGLGKTYTALAVIKYFELRNERVLVLCPKKLSRNWTIYRNPSSLNPFSDDKFRYDVLHHTDLSRESGNVNGIHLDTLNWGAYDLVVIDESHNFRNNNLATQRPGDTTERRSRYQRLMEDIISAGVKTKVLLLSATPVNNQLADLRNQISFIAGGDVARNDVADSAFSEKLNIPSIRDTTDAYSTFERNTGTFAAMLPGIVDAITDDDIDGNGTLDAPTKGILKTQRKRFRQLLKAEHVERLRQIKLIDDILACTERVLNPAAHSGTPPLYEKEVHDALKLVKQLETTLTP